MTTPIRPIIGVDTNPGAPSPQLGGKDPRASQPDLPIARDLPQWDLLPSDLLLVRRRTVKK